jgi:ribosomal-protein-alanine N-acetyltransferase
MSPIRPMTPADLEAVLGIEVASFATPWSRALFAEELARPHDRAWVVAEDRSLIVGFGGIMVAPDGAHVMNLAVDPGARRAGIAREVLLHLAAEAHQRGAGRMTLEVREAE